MSYSEIKLRTIFDSGDGKCYVCGTTLEFGHYSQELVYDGWEVLLVEDKKQRRSLKPACLACKRAKLKELW